MKLEVNWKDTGGEERFWPFMRAATGCEPGTDASQKAVSV